MSVNCYVSLTLIFAYMVFKADREANATVQLKLL